MSSIRWPAAFCSAATSDVSILVVDSSATMRRIVVQSLERIGYDDAREAGSAAEAIDQLDGRVDAVITAWSTDDVSGADLIRTLRTGLPGSPPPILVVLTRSTKREAPSALAAGAADYLIKPLTPQALREKLASVLPRLAA